jgi:multidrug resistance efflux pump
MVSCHGTNAKIGAVLAGIVAIILILTFVPWQLTIEGKGSLWPEARTKIYAPYVGIIYETPSEHGQVVEKGQPLLKMENRDLQRELDKVIAERDEAKSKIVVLRRQIARSGSRPDEQAQMQGEMAQAEVKVDSSNLQIELLNEQLKTLAILAPQKGIVTHPYEVKKELLGRPVEVGQELMEIAATDGDWVLEVEVPDDDMGPVLAAESKLHKEIADGKKPPDAKLEAYFVIATDPEHRYHGSVIRRAAKAETVEGKTPKPVFFSEIGFLRSAPKHLVVSPAVRIHPQEFGYQPAQHTYPGGPP